MHITQNPDIVKKEKLSVHLWKNKTIKLTN